MTDSTTTYWSADGVSLQTLCQNVESLAPKYGTVPFRGSNQSVAYRPGRTWREKTADSRVLPLGMWVTGMGADGKPTVLGQERQFHENMVALERLLYTEGRRQVTLTKRWKDPATGAVVAASALAEPQPFEVTMRGPHSARMVVDFDLADPYFYGDEVQVLGIPMDTPTVVNVDGDVQTSRIELAYHGILSNPELRNQTTDPDHWLRVGSAIADGDTVTVDADSFTAVRTSDGANLVGSLTRSGGRSLMRLLPGANTLLLTASSGSGTVDLTYAPKYL